MPKRQETVMSMKTCVDKIVQKRLFHKLTYFGLKLFITSSETAGFKLQIRLKLFYATGPIPDFISETRGFIYFNILYNINKQKGNDWKIKKKNYR